MKYILKEITPLGGNDLFIANHWPDNQMDFPLHFHEDYELNLTLHVRGKRTVGNLVEDFTEKDLVITNPNVLHCYKRGESYANVRCEVVVVQFSKNLPSWGIFDTDQLRPIREMLCQPAPGIRFSEDTADRVRDRLLRLPHLEGFEAVLLFLDILHELACADRTKVELIGLQGDAASTRSCSSWSRITAGRFRSTKSAVWSECRRRPRAVFSKNARGTTSGTTSADSGSTARRK